MYAEAGGHPYLSWGGMTMGMRRKTKKRGAEPGSSKGGRFMAKKEYSFELKSSLSELDNLCLNLEDLGEKIGLSKKLIFEINLALDELFTNIISYGFSDEDEHIIKVTVTPQKEEICLCIEDDGVPFNPIEFETPDVACSVENCKVGGLGIHIMRKLMDDICYQRCGDKNVLTLKKNLSQDES
jgi:serine/threonine-protein kinase RsbW